MHKQTYISHNKYFLIPFIAWVVIGGVLQIVFTQEQLFAAFNTHSAPVLDWLMYYDTLLGQGIIITVVLLLLWLLPRFRNLWYFAAALFCNVIPFLLQQWLKSYFNLPRPLDYFHKASWIHKLPDWPELLHRSFPSGHSEGAFSFFCFLSMLLSVKYRKLGLVFFLLGLSVCYSRMYLAAHFFEDVYAGSILGVTLTTAIFAIMDKYKSFFVLKKAADA